MFIAEIAGFFVVMIVFGIALLLLNIFTSVWAFRDAQRKGHSAEYAMLVLIGTLFFPVIGFIVYLIIRSDNRSNNRETY